MSGLFFSGAAEDPANAVSIQVGNQRISGWESLAISRSVEAMPNQFMLTMSDQYPQDPNRLTLYPGQTANPSTVYIGDDVVITGYVDRCMMGAAPNRHEITITGRGLCQDLVDCSADLLQTHELQGATFSAENVLDAAHKLAKPFGISARSAVSDLGKQIPPFTISIGETSYQVLERICRYAGFLLYEDENGTLVLDRVGTTKHASGFSMPGNIENARSELAIDQRYSVYIATWQSVLNLETIDALDSQAGRADDLEMPRYRPLFFQCEMGDSDVSLAKRRAEWELKRRRGRSQSVFITCDSWRDSEGKLWTPNYRAPINAPALKMSNTEWLIGAVTYRKDLSGTHADLVLMPPEAYDPEPSPLNLWDREMAAGVPSLQTPPPSGTPGDATGDPQTRR